MINERKKEHFFGSTPNSNVWRNALSKLVFRRNARDSTSLLTKPESSNSVTSIKVELLTNKIYLLQCSFTKSSSCLRNLITTFGLIIQ
jgi:hypothetical protein